MVAVLAKGIEEAEKTDIAMVFVGQKQRRERRTTVSDKSDGATPTHVSGAMKESLR